MSVSNRFEYIQRGVGKISLNVDMLYLFNHFFLEFSNFKRNASHVETNSKMLVYFLKPFKFCCVKCQVSFVISSCLSSSFVDLYGCIHVYLWRFIFVCRCTHCIYTQVS